MLVESGTGACRTEGVENMMDSLSLGFGAYKGYIGIVEKKMEAKGL